MTRELLEAINIQAKREGFFWPVLRAIVFEQLAQTYPAKHLLDILKDHRGGSWGTDQQPQLLPAPSLRSPDIRHGSINLSQAETRYYTPSELEKHRLDDGDILVIKSNGSLDLVGKSQLFSTTAAASPVTASNFVLILSPDSAQVDPTYLDWFLKSPQALVWRVDKQRTTTGLRNLDTDGYLASSVPLPPSKEIQKEIVQILNAVGDGDWPDNPHFDIRLAQRAKSVSDAFEQLDAEAEHQENLLDKLQQAILQEAIQGKLTADWRAAHPKIEPASKLLHRIQAEKARLIAAKQLRPEKPLPILTPAEMPFEIPRNWEWCRLDKVAIDFSYGTSQKAHLEAEGIPVLRMGNITSDGELTYSNLKYVSPKIKDLPRLFLKPGDIVFNRTNSYELVGKSAVFRHGEPFTLASYLIRVRLFQELVPEYAAYFINSAICRTEFIEPDVIQQNGQANFNGTKLKSIPIPLPPLAEQAEIVARVVALLTNCRLLAAEIARTRTHAAHLLQAVLKEAFTPAAEPRANSKQAKASEPQTIPA
jgi:type I restriction enzyme S subunit